MIWYSLDELFSAATVSGGVGSHASSGISAVSGARGLPNEGRNYDAGAGAGLHYQNSPVK